MGVLVIASVMVTIYVTLYFVHNTKHIIAVKNGNKSNGKDEKINYENKNSENSRKEKCLTASIGSGLLLFLCICATALIWALV